jgi:GNAT superfamily N-acetyltransferase
VERSHLRSADGRLVLVAADEQDQVVAFIDLEPDGHIDRLFRAPEAVGQHIASRLYDGIEAAARAQGIGRLYTEASELARRFFERKDFIVLAVRAGRGGRPAGFRGNSVPGGNLGAVFDAFSSAGHRSSARRSAPAPD